MTPVRLLKNDFYNKVEEIYLKGGSAEELKELLGRGRSKKGMFEGDLVEGELEIGQVAGLISKIKLAGEIVTQIMLEYTNLRKDIVRGGKFCI